MTEKLVDVVAEELRILEILIKDLSNNLFGKPDYRKMLVTTFLKNPPIRKMFVHKYGSLIDDAYLENENKLNCSRAASNLAMAKTFAEENNLSDAIKWLCKANLAYGAAAIGYDYSKMIDKYQKGLKIKAKVSKEKWALAQQYFTEEIPIHKTLLQARKAAAKRAGIYVNDRRLIKMLPSIK